jgi:hypothetical protein
MNNFDYKEWSHLNFYIYMKKGANLKVGTPNNAQAQIVVIVFTLGMLMLPSLEA